MDRAFWLVLLAAPLLGATYPLDFESPADAALWRASSGPMALDNQRSRHGGQSLHWRWSQAGATLTLADPGVLAEWAKLGDKDFAAASFGLWLRWPEPTREVLRVEFVAGDQVVGRGWWGLGYRGWRPLLAPLARFGLARGVKVDAVRLSPPGAVGELWVDWVQPSSKQVPERNPQHPWMANDQLPLTDPLARPDDWREVRLSRDDLASGRPWLPARVTPPADDLARLTQRLATAPIVPARGRGLAPGVLDGLTEAVRRQWGIAADGSLRGPGTRASTLLAPADGLSTADYLPLLGRFRDAAAKASAAEWPQVKALLTDLVAYTVDQGMAFGSAFAEPFGPYGLRNHLANFRDLRGCLDDPALRREFVLQGVQLLIPGQDDPSRSLLGPRPYGDTDWLHGYHNYLPQMIACLDDPADRWQFWGAYTWCMDTITLSPDLTEPDGGMYHHGMVHYGYSGYSFPGLVSALAPFRDTALRAKPATLRRLKEVARWMAWTSQMGSVPNTFYARPGANVGACGPEVYWTLAQFGSADAREPADRELAEIYLAKQPNAADAVAKRLLGEGYRAATLEGHRPQNSQGDTVHRRGDWMVGIGGWHNQRAHAECYGWLEDGTNYAPFVGLGGTMVLLRAPDGKVDTGFDERGWDWCHWPGTTAVRRSAAELFSQYTWYSSNSPLAGAVALDGDGVWAMDVRSGEVRCHKTAFCFGDRITFVTTDIAGGDRPRLTTLYQQRLGDVGAGNLAPTLLDGQRVDALDERTLATDAPHWLLDARGIGYLTEPGGGKLVVRRGEQSWFYPYSRFLRDAKQNPKAVNSTSVKWVLPGATPEQVLATPKGQRYPPQIEGYYQPTTGVFASAWFDHGADAVGSDNVFTLVPHATAERLAELARTRPYRLVGRTKTAHVLLDLASDTYGYGIFEAGSLPDGGPLRAASRPCFAMVQAADGGLRLAVASSDGQANGTDGVEMKPGAGGGYPIAGTPLLLTLAGAWQVASIGNPGCTVTARRVGADTELSLKLPWRLGLEVRLRQ